MNGASYALAIYDDDCTTGAFDLFSVREKPKDSTDAMEIIIPVITEAGNSAPVNADTGEFL